MVQLHRIHAEKYERARSGSEAAWVIPFADNNHGMGKSYFAMNYIAKSREMWPVTTRDKFQQTLCDCHTIRITFDSGDLADGDFDSVLLQQLKSALCNMFEFEPYTLSKGFISVDEFLEELTALAGPVFIALDGIGAAFYKEKVDYYDDYDDYNRYDPRDMFLSFCDKVLSKWITMKKVFFVILGYNDFLQTSSTAGRFVLERLNLPFLQQDAINKILSTTLVSQSSEHTIASSLRLDDKRAHEVAKNLFKQTNGHPQTLLSALSKCKTYKEIVEYQNPWLDKEFDTLQDHLDREKEILYYLLDKAKAKTRVDLREKMGRSWGDWDPIVSKVKEANILWDNVHDAELYFPPEVQSYLEDNLMPFRRYLSCAGENSLRSRDNSTIFRWMVLKRFQEIFRKPKEPGKAHSDFFNTSLFGRCESVCFPSATRLKSIYSLDCLPMLLESKWRYFYKPFCLKPAESSLSSDAFLGCKSNLNSQSVKLTVGLAVKNDASEEFSSSGLESECRKVECVFTDHDVGSGYRRDAESSLNVLIICCTHLSGELAEKFKDQPSHAFTDERFPSIHEIILVDLSDPARRSRFFAVEGKESEYLEGVIRKQAIDYLASSSEEIKTST
ncbi:hypothetical protein HDU96_007603 [Phlyctochytrium bullatum]|nr:hypothetical protein HDU96_007603 [Phlyctochytrium bullatum]